MQISDERMEILAQGFVAFGAGSQGYRVSRDACQLLIKYFLAFVAETPEGDLRVKNWDDANYGAEMLDRVVVLGRIAADLALTAGHSAVRLAEVEKAIERVELGALQEASEENRSPCRTG
jgi:hypothetical protein